MWLFDGVVRQALAEDIGPGDITTEATVPPGLRRRARVVAKAPGVLSGMDVFRRVFDLLDADVAAYRALDDGAAFAAGAEVASFEGDVRAILTGERVALNFLQHLSGVATQTRAFVDAVAGLPVRIVETRKTTPLLRNLEKRAVRHGGGANHRHALYDGFLIKENHIAAAGGIGPALERAQAARNHLARIEIEVRDLAELEEALEGGADVILLDNMSLDDMAAAVRRVQGSNVVLEASGNMTLERVRAVAETGVHVISVGALTHSVRAVDLSLLVDHG